MSNPLLVRSILTAVEELEDNLGSGADSKVLPDYANEKVMTGGAGVWGEGSYTEIAADVGSADVYLRGFVCTAVTGLHQMTIATGAAASEVDGAKLAVATTGYYPISSVAIPANSRLAAKTASKAGTSQTVEGFFVYTN